MSAGPLPQDWADVIRVMADGEVQSGGWTETLAFAVIVGGVRAAALPGAGAGSRRRGRDGLSAAPALSTCVKPPDERPAS